jgi:hypothetical protein
VRRQRAQGVIFCNAARQRKRLRGSGCVANAAFLGRQRAIAQEREQAGVRRLDGIERGAVTRPAHDDKIRPDRWSFSASGVKSFSAAISITRLVSFSSRSTIAQRACQRTLTVDRFGASSETPKPRSLIALRRI